MATTKMIGSSHTLATYATAPPMSVRGSAGRVASSTSLTFQQSGPARCLQASAPSAAKRGTRCKVRAVEAPPAPASPLKVVSNDKPTVVITGASSGLGLNAAKSENDDGDFCPAAFTNLSYGFSWLYHVPPALQALHPVETGMW